MPSLVSIPLLGYRDYDPNIYANTRNRLLNSQTNSYYFQGKEFKVGFFLPWFCTSVTGVRRTPAVRAVCR